jgi:drug/metabolite transporter (DMT)-like permease
MKKSFMADITLFIVAIVWGSGFVATKVLLNAGIQPFYMMGLRFIIAGIGLGVIFNKQLFKIKKTDILSGFIVGFLLFLSFGAQTVGLQFTTPSMNAFLTGVNVVVVPFLYWIVTKKRPDRYAFAAVFICFIGTAILSSGGDMHFGLGEALSLLCAFLFAGHIVANGHYVEKSGAVILTFLQMIFAAMFSFSTAFTIETFPDVVSSETWMAIAYVGIVTTMLAFFLQTWAQKNTTTTKVAIILSTEVIFGSLFSVVLLGELLTPNMIMGGIAIFIAIITAETKWNFLKFKKKIVSI